MPGRFHIIFVPSVYATILRTPKYPHLTRLLSIFRPYIGQFVLLLVAVFLMVAGTLALPDFMATIINTGIVPGNIDVVWMEGGKMLLLAIGAAVASVVVGFFASRIATGYARDVRAAVFTTVENFSLEEFNSFSTASLITRSTNDVQQLQTVLVMLLRMALMAPFMGVWAIFKAYAAAPSITWIMGLAVGILIAIIAVLFAVAVPRFKRIQNLVDSLNLVTREILTGLRVIRAFHRETDAEAKFDGVNTELTGVNLFVNRILVIMQPAMMLIMNLTVLGVVWYGAHLIDAGTLQIGGTLAFMQYAMQAIFSFLLITMVFIIIPRALVSAQRIAEVLRTEVRIKDPVQPVSAATITDATVRFENVSFAYAGAEEPVLKDVSFTALPGQTTAIIGSTGSGKSTLVNLIPRLYDPTEGTVKIGGVDIKQLRLEDVHAQMGYVPQKGILFSGTVIDNIRYGAPDASVMEVARAAVVSQASEFISGLEKGYTSPITQGGTNVSGGQRQRLSIARAVVRDPKIYIFDDSFSALDFATDAKLRAALAPITKHATVLIVAQRIGTILHADKIIVLDEGRIVGEGTHTALMTSCPIYREIAESQLSKADLDR